MRYVLLPKSKLTLRKPSFSCWELKRISCINKYVGLYHGGGQVRIHSVADCVVRMKKENIFNASLFIIECNALHHNRQSVN